MGDYSIEAGMQRVCPHPEKMLICVHCGAVLPYSDGRTTTASTATTVWIEPPAARAPGGDGGGGGTAK